MSFLYVICTVAWLDSTNYLHVVSAPGTVLKDGAKRMQERLKVDFGDNAPFSPAVRWVDENDCLYVKDTNAKINE